MHKISEHKILSAARHNIHKRFDGTNPAPPIPNPVPPATIPSDVPGSQAANKPKVYNLTQMSPHKVGSTKSKYLKNALT